MVATAGVGRFQVEGRPALALLPGDSVTIPAAERHWHGASPDQLFIHISIQAAGEGGEQATWLEPISEEDYGYPPTREGVDHA